MPSASSDPVPAGIFGGLLDAAGVPVPFPAGSDTVDLGTLAIALARVVAPVADPAVEAAHKCRGGTITALAGQWG